MNNAFITSPAKTVSQGITSIINCGNRSCPLLKNACEITARAISGVVFPIFLLLELVLKKVPQMILSIGKESFDSRAHEALKYLVFIIPSIPMGFYDPEWAPNHIF